MLISALRTFIKNSIKESFYEEKKKKIKFFVHLKDILRGARGHVPPLAHLAPPLITISLHDLFNKGHANECP